MIAALMLGALFLLSFMSTTKEQRAAARKAHHPYDKIVGAVALILAISLFF